MKSRLYEVGYVSEKGDFQSLLLALRAHVIVELGSRAHAQPSPRPSTVEVFAPARYRGVDVPLLRSGSGALLVRDGRGTT